jgi:hypothetical protein
MSFSDLELKLIDNEVGGLCRKLNQPEYKDELNIEYRIDKHDVVIFERRPAYNQPNEITELPVAKFKFLRGKHEWRLLWMRGDLNWHSYKPFSLSESLGDLVAEVKTDPYGCFWGLTI